MKIQIIKGKVKNKVILNNVTLNIRKGTSNAILGRNGAGKSSLLYMITNHPIYEFTGDVKDIPEKVFMTFQKPPEIPEITVDQLLIYLTNQYDKPCETIEQFKTIHFKVLKELEFPVSLFTGLLNKDMSGGENKKLELLCMYLMKPELILLDEVDTGLDLDTMIFIGKFLQDYILTYKPTLIVVTHNMEFLKYFSINKVFVLDKGNLVGTYEQSIIKEIKQEGFIKTFKLC